MQINHYQTIQTLPISQNIVLPETVNNRTSLTEPSVQVTLSAQAKRLAKTDNSANQVTPKQPVQLPTDPQNALTGEKLEQAVQFKKAQLHYQTVAEMGNILYGESNKISAPTAYYLSKNEDARELVVQTNAQQQMHENMKTYQEKTNAMHEQYV